MLSNLPMRGKGQLWKRQKKLGEWQKRLLKEEDKAKERERKARAVCAKAKEKAMFAEEKQRMWKFACILSWIFFVIVMLLLCFSSIEFSRV